MFSQVSGRVPQGAFSFRPVSGSVFLSAGSFVYTLRIVVASTCAAHRGATIKSVISEPTDKFEDSVLPSARLHGPSHNPRDVAGQRSSGILMGIEYAPSSSPIAQRNRCATILLTHHLPPPLPRGIIGQQWEGRAGKYPSCPEISLGRK